MSDAPKIRAFVALKPPEVWAEHFGRLQNELRRTMSSSAFRWVDPNQLHITLRFFGWLTPDEIGPVAKALSGSAKISPFVLQPDSLGAFPSQQKPRVLWMGLRGDVECAVDLQRAICRGTGHIGTPPENRPFTPHFTLARGKNPGRSESQAWESITKNFVKFDFSWEVREIYLMRSHLSQAGATYETLLTAKLG